MPLVDSRGVDLERVIAALAPATVANPVPVEFASLAYDSRAVIPGTLFFCVRGERVDGHVFAGEAIERGAVALVVERPLDLAGYPNSSSRTREQRWRPQRSSSTATPRMSSPWPASPAPTARRRRASSCSRSSQPPDGARACSARSRTASAASGGRPCARRRRRSTCSGHSGRCSTWATGAARWRPRRTVRS